MTFDVGRIIGAIIAIAIVYILAEALVRGAAALGIPLHPIVGVIKWAVCGIFACLAIAWAFGVDIPFIQFQG